MPDIRMPNVDWRRQRILVVGADSAFVAWARDVLRGVGATEIETAGGAEAVAKQASFKAGIVLIELNVEAAHPVELVRSIMRTSEKAGYTPLVIPVADKASPELLRQVCAIGIQSFVRKPTDRENLIRRVGGAILNPRRFVFTRRYFGPDRRRHQVKFDGPDRRRAVAQQVTRPKVPAAGARSVPPVDRPAPAVATEDDAKAKPSAPAATVPAMREIAAATPVPPVPPATVKPTKLVASIKPTMPATNAVPGRAVPGRNGAPALKNTPARKGGALGVTLIDDATVEASTAGLDDGVRRLLDQHRAWLVSNGAEGACASFEDVDFRGFDLGRVDLSGANMRRANLTDANCREAVFQGTDLRQADLSSADIIGGDMGVAKLRHSVMRRTLLDGANLRGADLAGASLCGASLKETDFAGANLLSADLRHTDLRTTKGLTQVQIDRALADATTRLPFGLRLPRREE